MLYFFLTKDNIKLRDRRKDDPKYTDFLKAVKEKKKAKTEIWTTLMMR